MPSIVGLPENTMFTRQFGAACDKPKYKASDVSGMLANASKLRRSARSS